MKPSSVTAPNPSALHAAYCAATGINLPYSPLHHDQDWWLWSKGNWTEADLKLVVEYLRKTVDDKKILLNMLRFSYLIRQVDNFAEWLSVACAARRAPAPSNRDKILAQTFRAPQRPYSEPETAYKVSQRALDMLAKCKEGLKG